jgi:hypothetical protein
MAHHEEAHLDPQQVTLPQTGLWPKLPVIGGVLAVLGLGLSYALGSGDSHHLAGAYLTGYLYWWTLAMGGLFFTVLHYLARSGWSVVVRRLAENVASVLPYFIVLFLPILYWMHDLFHWTHEKLLVKGPEYDPLIAHKEPYLNTGFFTIRAGIFFAVWCLIFWYFNRQSRRQDESGDLDITRKLNTWSALAMVGFAITINFAAFDWIMSLEPHWFSTIFGVYVFAGSVVAILAFLIVVVTRLQAAGALEGVVTGEHYHDLGKLLFGFVVFWAYIGFSQFMLIWYANIPEETLWFEARWLDGWQPVSLFLAAGHFVVPFFYFISQPIKRNRLLMTLGALWVLFMHYVDLYWMVMPTFGGFHPVLVDFTTWLGIGGVFLVFFGLRMKKGSLVPLKDPRLAESLAFENA